MSTLPIFRTLALLAAHFCFAAGSGVQPVSPAGALAAKVEARSLKDCLPPDGPVRIVVQPVDRYVPGN